MSNFKIKELLENKILSEVSKSLDQFIKELQENDLDYFALHERVFTKVSSDLLNDNTEELIKGLLIKNYNIEPEAILKIGKSSDQISRIFITLDLTKMI